MASDEDYAAFLDKANQDPNEGVKTQSTKGEVELKAVDHGVEVPGVLKTATREAFYVSDADEPFVPVALKLGKGKGMPDESVFVFFAFYREKKMVLMRCRYVCEACRTPKHRGCRGQHNGYWGVGSAGTV